MYSWCDYYRNAYEQARKNNTVLAEQIADAEAEKERIQGESLYRLLCLFSGPKRGLGKIKRGIEKFMYQKPGGRVRAEEVIGTEYAGNGGKTPEELRESYQERLTKQIDCYGQWIKEEEAGFWKKQDKAWKRCEVIPYGRFSKITSVTEIESGNRDNILLFVKKPEELDEHAVSYIEDWFCTHPETKLLYGGEDQVSGGNREFPWMKPCWSPDTLLGFFYFGSFFAVDRVWAEKTALKGYEDAKENLYDYVLRLLRPYFEKGTKEIVCSERILYHRNTDTGSEKSSKKPSDIEHPGEMAYEEHPEYWGFEKKYVKLKQDFLKGFGFESFAYQTADPNVWTVVPTGMSGEQSVKKTVSVIIPSKDHPELVKKCIGSFLEKTDLPEAGNRFSWEYEFIIVDNGSTEEQKKEIEAYYSSVDADCHYLYQPMEFNFSAMCNRGAEAAKGEYLLFLNDDIEILEKNWLRIMLGQAVMPGTGAVGAKLWYPEKEKIQHAGVTNMHVGPSHKLAAFPDDRTYYYGHNTLPYNMIAVTGACLMIKKSVYREVGGMDEEMAVSYNDVDLCFKTYEAGYRNVVRNDAVLLHYESLSRGLDAESDDKWYRLLTEKTKLYRKHALLNEKDPYYSELLADNTPDYRVGYLYSFDRQSETIAPKRREGKRILRKIPSGGMMLTVEWAALQQKTRLNEPDVLKAEGWSFLPAQDNCLFERLLILEHESEDFYYQAPVGEKRRPDVEAVFPQQTNIALSGFIGRIARDDGVSDGNYRIGMLYRDQCSNRLYYQCSDKTVCVENGAEMRGSR